MLIGQGKYMLVICDHADSGYILRWYNDDIDEYEAPLLIFSGAYDDPECTLAARTAARIALHDQQYSENIGCFWWPTFEAAEAAYDAIVDAIDQAREVSYEA